MMPLDIGLSASSSSGAQSGTVQGGDFNFGGGKRDMTAIIVGGAVILVGFIAWLMMRQ